MKPTRTNKALGWLAAALTVAALSFIVGGQLKPEPDPHYIFNLDAPAYEGDVGAIAARSPAGFTGFGDLGSGDDHTVLGGRVIEVSATALTLETPTGVRTTLRLASASKLSRIESGSRDLLKPGAAVVVRLGEQRDVAAALLVLQSP
jgi:hypothetical protein